MNSPGNSVGRPEISVVLPVFNESENLNALLSRLLPVLDRAANDSFELVFIDDGSHDGSAELLDALSEEDSRINVVHFSRNFGHQLGLRDLVDRGQQAERPVGVRRGSSHRCQCRPRGPRLARSGRARS